MQKYDLSKSYVKEVNSNIALETDQLSVFYGKKQATYDISLKIPKNSITALIGASGSGKSTYLRSLNRMNENGNTNVNGKIIYEGIDINSSKVNVYEVRKHIGMVFQEPNPFAKSIRGNITFALKNHGIKDKKVLEERVVSSLKQAAIWDEVKDHLDDSAMSLSGGQKQRLCIARAIAMQPDILLLDEPTSALDPVSTGKIEETLRELKKNYTIIIVTHNIQQASRVSDYTAFMHSGHLLEYNDTNSIFNNPEMQITNDYISGHFG
ncbi:phosphate ABC transporter ATP-binding protein PstB [Apilactobacillus sp. TMW 2.2459]|uniref:phosphate ABC transporter ATP-binding protein PstB n=1 Tax=Apilactobacillus xinyiensis TaxID=2841032 RepID=UPI00200E8AF8|nr:phosphate ABC transporter ATP-binding protein PstB [Apilactobacillus xinyiensis]MCL0311894.1 phosphate ABC transporter ATP-binding protein PstB [Apilactobacillus xinyiensis]